MYVPVPPMTCMYTYTFFHCQIKHKKLKIKMKNKQQKETKTTKKESFQCSRSKKKKKRRRTNKTTMKNRCKSIHESQLSFSFFYHSRNGIWFFILSFQHSLSLSHPFWIHVFVLISVSFVCMSIWEKKGKHWKTSKYTRHEVELDWKLKKKKFKRRNKFVMWMAWSNVLLIFMCFCIPFICALIQHQYPHHHHQQLVVLIK